MRGFQENWVSKKGGGITGSWWLKTWAVTFPWYSFLFFVRSAIFREELSGFFWGLSPFVPDETTLGSELSKPRAADEKNVAAECKKNGGRPYFDGPQPYFSGAFFVFENVGTRFVTLLPHNVYISPWFTENLNGDNNIQLILWLLLCRMPSVLERPLYKGRVHHGWGNCQPKLDKVNWQSLSVRPGSEKGWHFTSTHLE